MKLASCESCDQLFFNSIIFIKVDFSTRIRHTWEQTNATPLSRQSLLSYVSVPDFQVQNCALGAILGFQEGAPSITVGGEVPVRQRWREWMRKEEVVLNKNDSPPNSRFWSVGVENRGEIGREEDRFWLGPKMASCLVWSEFSIALLFSTWLTILFMSRIKYLQIFRSRGTEYRVALWPASQLWRELPHREYSDALPGSRPHQCQVCNTLYVHERERKITSKTHLLLWFSAKAWNWTK